jgi:hypothetical protein
LANIRDTNIRAKYPPDGYLPFIRLADNFPAPSPVRQTQWGRAFQRFARVGVAGNRLSCEDDVRA